MLLGLSASLLGVLILAVAPTVAWQFKDIAMALSAHPLNVSNL